ncbi:Protein of unknown function [Gryllus bimaculatus]|nr:Protein of unknown function [Gryllus bimaculatus]
MLRKALMTTQAEPVDVSQAKVTVVGVGAVGMACAFSVMVEKSAALFTKDTAGQKYLEANRNYIDQLSAKLEGLQVGDCASQRRRCAQVPIARRSPRTHRERNGGHPSGGLMAGNGAPPGVRAATFTTPHLRGRRTRQ